MQKKKKKIMTTRRTCFIYLVQVNKNVRLKNYTDSYAFSVKIPRRQHLVLREGVRTLHYRGGDFAKFLLVMVFTIQKI